MGYPNAKSDSRVNRPLSYKHVKSDFALGLQVYKTHNIFLYSKMNQLML